VTVAQVAGVGVGSSSGEQQWGLQGLGEAEWIKAARQGDGGAFGCLVRKYQDRLSAGLLKICGCADEAQDVAQEAFVQAHNKLGTFAGSSTFYTWLYRIATNIAITRHRRRRKVVSLEQGRQAAASEPHDDGEHAVDKLLREERAQHVRIALEQLNIEHRNILVLREIEGCDYDTISRILELPVGTVRSRLHRARLQLRDKLVIVLGDSRPAAPVVLPNAVAEGNCWWSSN
jgi:RNA polymerase sigma-70 factor (ECF subfamily)